MNEKKKILIVSYCFAPQNVIGAVRATKLAKYLTRMGHEVTVICGEGLSSLKDPTLDRDLRELKDVHVVREWNPIRDRKQQGAGESAAGSAEGKKAAQSPKNAGLTGRLRDALYRFLLLCSDRSFACRSLREIRSLGRRFDAVITSYGPLSSHWIGYGVKRRGMAAEWIADFRDVVELPFLPGVKWAKGYLGKAAKHADCITGVSAGYLAAMGLEGEAIPNGFDQEDLLGLDREPHGPGDALRFVYCGQMYGAQRDLRPFFRAVKELSSEGVIPEQSLSFAHAGKKQDAAIFYEQAEAAGLGSAVKKHGMLPRDEAIELQLSADVVLIAAWNTPECPGNLPGKLLEVLMMNRPVLCCTTGTVRGSESARVIQKTGVGFCYEEVEGERAYRELKAYLKGLCEAFVQGAPMPFAPVESEVAGYAYPHIARRFEALLCGGGFDEE